MATVDLSLETLESTIEENDIVLIDFWADWCGPCKMFAPTYEKVSEEYDNIVFAKVDTEAHQELAAQFQIRSIPTLVVFKDQVGIFAQPGALPEEGLRDLIGQVESLDMDEVRKEIADQDTGEPATEHATEHEGADATA
jgi:thioredoxin 1